jgi:hypothetical protein
VRDNTVTDPYEVPFRLAEELKGNPEFRLAFADRVQKHFFDEGALTPAVCAARWTKRASEVDRAIIAESARWGYYRRSTPYTRDKEWLKEQQRLLTEYFPRRTGIVLEQLRAIGLYPRMAPPTPRLSQAGELSLPSSGGATIYYTTNGLDPRVPFTGAVAAHALTGRNDMRIPAATPVKARAWKDGIWSALVETGGPRDAR